MCLFYFISILSDQKHLPCCVLKFYGLFFVPTCSVFCVFGSNYHHTVCIFMSCQLCDLAWPNNLQVFLCFDWFLILTAWTDFSLWLYTLYCCASNVLFFVCWPIMVRGIMDFTPRFFEVHTHGYTVALCSNQCLFLPGIQTFGDAGLPGFLI